MKRSFYYIVLAGILIVTVPSALFSEKLRSAETSSPATSSEGLPQVSAKSPTAKTTDESRRARTNPTRPNQVTEKRGFELPSPGIADPALPSSQTGEAQAGGIKMDWISINHGGAIEVASGNLKLGLSIAQTVAGEVSSENLKMGLGFWYGAGAAGSDCLCPHQADLDTDGYPTALDLGILVDITFIGAPDPPNPGCPTSRGDFDFDSYVNALDVAKMIDYLFIGGPGPCDPCNPVQAMCVTSPS